MIYLHCIVYEKLELFIQFSSLWFLELLSVLFILTKIILVQQQLTLLIKFTPDRT